MKRFNHHKLAILPLLGILAMSPSVMSSKFASRGIASVEDGKPEVKREVKEEKKEEAKKEESKTPKYDALVSKVDPKSIMKDIDNNIEKFSKKRDELSAKIIKERQEFKESSDKLIVEEQRKKVESLVIDVLLVDGSLKDLQEKKGIEGADLEASIKKLDEVKGTVESMLTDLESNEVLVAKASEPKKDEPKVEEPKKDEPKIAEEPKKEEVKKEEVKKEEVKKEEVKVADDKKEEKKDEAKKEEKTDSEKLLCEVQEQNKILTKQVEQLINDQKQLMNTFMGMAQMMVGQYQQQQANQHNPYYQNGPGFNSSPYQYNAPMSAGNWVYYPQGFQPQQPNIFAQPQPQMQMGGFYPDQMHMQQQPQQQSAQWGLQPQMNFQIPSYGDQRYQQYPQFTPGTFGDSQFSFNMQNQLTPAPLLSMR